MCVCVQDVCTTMYMWRPEDGLLVISMHMLISGSRHRFPELAANAFPAEPCPGPRVSF